jgi:hypothetical protein
MKKQKIQIPVHLKHAIEDYISNYSCGCMGSGHISDIDIEYIIKKAEEYKNEKACICKNR